MNSLIDISPTDLTALATRSREVCVVFSSHPLPKGTIPARGRVGVEQNPNETLLHVQRGYHYVGSDAEVREWIRTGTRTFHSVGECAAWANRVIVPQGPDLQPQASRRPAAIERLDVAEVTDLEAIEVKETPLPSSAHLKEALATQILGQDAALDGLASLASQHLARVNPRRPASALLIGPTGTGKTLAAEQLAHILTDGTASEWSYHRLDLSEFSEQHSVSRLFGAPPGYVGYSDGQDLGAALRANPRSVILFDEIDKAHPQVWRSLMNLMDAGRLGSQADDIDARQAILMFTSNRDAVAVQSVADSDENRLRRFLRDHGYPPEIVARMGRILVFTPLPAHIRVRLIVLTVQRVVETFGLSLRHIHPAAVADLAGRAPVQDGGRDVEYFIEREISAQLATYAGVVDAIQIAPGPLIVPVD